LEIGSDKYFFSKSSDCDEKLNQFESYKITLNGVELIEAGLILLDKKIDELILEIANKPAPELTDSEKMWYYENERNNHLCNAIEQMKEYWAENEPYKK